MEIGMIAWWISDSKKRIQGNEGMLLWVLGQQLIAEEYMGEIQCALVSI